MIHDMYSQLNLHDLFGSCSSSFKFSQFEVLGVRSPMYQKQGQEYQHPTLVHGIHVGSGTRLLQGRLFLTSAIAVRN